MDATIILSARISRADGIHASQDVDAPVLSMLAQIIQFTLQITIVSVTIRRWPIIELKCASLKDAQALIKQQEINIVHLKVSPSMFASS